MSVVGYLWGEEWAFALWLGLTKYEMDYKHVNFVPTSGQYDNFCIQITAASSVEVSKVNDLFSANKIL